MNMTLRKLTMLQKSIAEQEEKARIQGFSTNVIDADFKQRVDRLIAKASLV